MRSKAPLLLLALLAVAPLAAFADEFLAPQPTAAEVGRYTIVRTAEATTKLDSMTGATWFLCPSPRKGRTAWCRYKDVGGLLAGPVGRYRLAEGSPLVLVDSVSGRSWAKCDLPTAEKGLAWCQVDE